jgi:hypothetical protein
MAQLRTSAGEVPILGFVVWWNLREVQIERDWFKAKLDSIGVDGERYAREHNYRATFIRCLRSLEEQRIIRKVTEDQDRLVFQFTAERLNDNDPQNPVLEYERESTIEIDKDAYWTEGNFGEAITKCDPKIKEIIVALFDKERVTYRSSDLTRYIQKIFGDHADLVALRPQGSVYFVPAAYQNLIANMANILATIPIGQASLEFFPVPDVESARNAVGHGVEAEIAEMFSKMEDEIVVMNKGSNDITDKWVQHRQRQIDQVKERIKKYSDVLGSTAQKLTGQFDALRDTLKPRVIEL